MALTPAAGHGGDSERGHRAALTTGVAVIQVTSNVTTGSLEAPGSNRCAIAGCKAAAARGVTAWRPANRRTPDTMVGIETARPLSLCLMPITPTAASPLGVCKT